MEIISRKDFEALLKHNQMPVSTIENMQAMDVYHINNWDHLIKFWDEDSKCNENPPLREFYFDLKEMLAFIVSYLYELNFKKAIIASLYGGRFIQRLYDGEHKHCVDEITKWLHTNKIRVNSSAGLLLTKNELMDNIGMISECGFMGMSELYVFIPEAGVAFKTHHHMNYFIFTNDLEKQKSIIKGLTDICRNVILYSQP